QCRVSRRGHAAGGEVDDRKFAFVGDLANELVRSSDLLGKGHSFFNRKHRQPANLSEDGASMTHGLHHVPGAGLAFGADHRSSLPNAPQRLTEVSCLAYEWDCELPLVDMNLLVGRSKHFAFIDAIDSQ